MNKNKQTIIAVVLIAASIAVAVIFVITALKETLTQLEIVFFQAITLFLGLLGSFVFGRQSAMQSARETIRPHARSAFRRLLSLFNSLSRLATAIENARSSKPMKDQPVLDKLEAIVTEQIATADDALEDWRDIVPEEVDEIREKFKETNGGEDNE